jgi:hypothetical protein
LRGTVYPRFGSAGDIVSIYSAEITEPVRCVKVGYEPVIVYLPGDEPQSVIVELPPDLKSGPQPIRIYDVDCTAAKKNTRPLAEIPASQFTGLPNAIPITEHEGTVVYDDISGAVDSFGTLLIPFDISGVREATQFYITIRNLALRFDAEDLSYYNKDEYNLKLFEHFVTGPEDYQWGPFYGTTTDAAPDPRVGSDTIEYWRHEFYTYAEAHAPGGSHEPNADGSHPDGTLHVDHDNLVLAISGWQSSSDNADDPYDPAVGSPLSPGSIVVDVVVGQLCSETAIALGDLTPEQQARLDGTALTLKSNDGKFRTANGGSYK